MFALVIFAIIAVVILVQLYNLLGRKVGFRVEDKPLQKKPDEFDPNGKVDARTPEVARLPNLEALKTRDVNFNEINFLEKARETYEQVVLAFHRGELDAVKDKLSDTVYAVFAKSVNDRTTPYTEVLSFVDTPKADLDVIDFRDDIAQIRVRFLSELAYETPAPEQTVAETVAEAVPEVAPVKKTRSTKAKAAEPQSVDVKAKEPAKPTRIHKRTAEYWTFQKALKTQTSPWVLSKVEAAKA